MSPSDFDSQQDRLNDNYVQVSYSYWNVLLTINGLILAFFSADLFLGDKDFGLLVNLLVLCCVISITLVLWNHKSLREFYFELASLTREEYEQLSPEKQGEMKLDDEKRFKYRKRRDSALEILMFSEAIILLLIVLSK